MYSLLPAVRRSISSRNVLLNSSHKRSVNSKAGAIPGTQDTPGGRDFCSMPAAEDKGEGTHCWSSCTHQFWIRYHDVNNDVISSVFHVYSGCDGYDLITGHTGGIGSGQRMEFIQMSFMRQIFFSLNITITNLNLIFIS